MINKDKLNEMFEGAESMEKEDAIRQVMDKCKLSEKTATAYYWTWKSNYMKAGGSLKSSSKGTKVQKKSSTESKEKLNLDIVGVTLSGENGTYTVCKEGIELHGEEQTLAFQNVQQWESFKNEFDKVFEYGKSNKILAS